ncbi:MAG: hypothetical protein NT039_02745 [Candidatus Berkelbacteria bacterium]|nr:hypothetical protein [Candidatus Berkelbacteria bacterium]
MHDINLLRPLIEQEQKRAQSKGRYSFYITFTVILIIIIAGAIFGAKFLLVSQSNSLDPQISSLEKDVSEVKSTEDKINNFNNIISQLKNVDKNKFTWSSIYDNIAKSTPTDVKLDKVSLVTTAATGSSTAASSSTAATAASSKLKITGQTKSRRSIALFQYKLQKVGGNFVTVDIISSKKTQAQIAATSGTEAASSQATKTEEKIDFEIDISLKSS